MRPSIYEQFDKAMSERFNLPAAQGTPVSGIICTQQSKTTRYVSIMAAFSAF